MTYFLAGVNTSVKRAITGLPSGDYSILNRQEISVIVPKGFTVPCIRKHSFVPVTVTQKDMSFVAFAAENALLPMYDEPALFFCC